jgi:hypothetical protein
MFLFGAKVAPQDEPIPVVLFEGALVLIEELDGILVPFELAPEPMYIIRILVIVGIDGIGRIM